jgi:hypothetical protein
MSQSTNKSVWFPYLLLLVMAALFTGISYFTPRENFVLFISQYIILFGAFYWFWLNKQQWSFQIFLLIAIVLRLISIAALPELSDDFYRFIWDGELLSRGINPFAHTPDELISYSKFYHDDYMREVLYHGMTELSHEHYTCYPVVNQIAFLIPALLFDSIVPSVVCLKIILILADIGSILIGKKILEHLGLSTHKVWLYGLNPLIILEFSGNLHFEGLMIFFLLASIYFLMRWRWFGSAIFMSLAVHTKLLPLMLLPFVMKKLRWRHSIAYVSLVGFMVLAIGLILLNEQFFHNMMDSVNEYFIRFEFNASVFYLIREIGFMVYGWDLVQIVGPILSTIATISILLVAAVKAYRNDLDIIKGMMFAFVIYHLLSTTVHPWYIAPILVLASFTNYKFGLIWSLLVMLSYFAYSNPEFKELPAFVITEYVVLYLVLFLELKWNTKKDAFGLQIKEFFQNPSSKPTSTSN